MYYGFDIGGTKIALGVYVRHLRVQRVDAAVLLHQRHGGLLSDARSAGDVMGTGGSIVSFRKEVLSSVAKQCEN